MAGMFNIFDTKIPIWIVVFVMDCSAEYLDLSFQSYKENIPKFLHQLEKSGADPDGIFFSSAMEEVLLPDGHEGWKRLVQTLEKRTGV